MANEPADAFAADVLDDPCAPPREALNAAQDELAAHRDAHGDADLTDDAPWGQERRRLTEAVAQAAAAYEDCVRRHDPTLQGTARPTAEDVGAADDVPAATVGEPDVGEPDDAEAARVGEPGDVAASPPPPVGGAHAAPATPTPEVVPSFLSPTGEVPTGGQPAGGGTPARAGAPPWLRDLLLKLETHPQAEKARLAVRDSAVMRAVPESAWSVLRGDRFGHALHPALTDVPVGSWISATVLDLIGLKRMRPAATALVGVGVVAAGPAAWTGWAEWREADDRSQRVGVVHAALNGAAALCYATSLVLRLSGRHRRAVTVGLLGSGLAGAGAYLGGHLALTRHVGTADPAATG